MKRTVFPNEIFFQQGTVLRKQDEVHHYVSIHLKLVHLQSHHTHQIQTHHSGQCCLLALPHLHYRSHVIQLDWRCLDLLHHLLSWYVETLAQSATFLDSRRMAVFLISTIVVSWRIDLCLDCSSIDTLTKSCNCWLFRGLISLAGRGLRIGTPQNCRNHEVEILTSMVL